MNNIMLICSAGGHSTELQYALEGVDLSKFNKQVFVSYNNFMADKYQYEYLLNPGRSLSKLLICSIHSLRLFLKYRPKVLISSGASIAVPMLLISFLFRRKIIFLESLAFIDEPTWTGRIAYKISSLFIIQNRELLRFYPKATLGRIL